MSTAQIGRQSQTPNIKNKAIVLALALACTATAAQAQTLSAQEIASRVIERRAVEAVIWGMPAVNYDLMLQ